MVGLQNAAVMEGMGSLLNGVVNYNTWLPEPSMYFDGTKAYFETYAKRAVEAKVDPLGYLHLALWLRDGAAARAGGQRDEVARPEGHRQSTCTSTSSRPSSGRSRSMPTANGRKTATLQAQFRNVADKNIEQFRQPRQAGDPVPGAAEDRRVG